MNIVWIGSPNFATVGRKPIKQIVLHWFGSKDSTLATTDNYFLQSSSQVSAHYGIEDKIIHQYVKEDHVAWANGVKYRNEETISIEHSANLTRNASDQTYETSGELVADICKRYNIPLDRDHIIGHKEIKATQCPGTIDIDRVIAVAKRYMEFGSNEQMAVITQRELDQLRFDRDNNHNMNMAAQEVIKKLNDVINDKNREIVNLNSSISTQADQLIILNDKVNSLSEQAKKVPALEKLIEEADIRVQKYGEENFNLINKVKDLEANNKDYTKAKASILLGELLKAIIEKRW